MVLSLEHDYVEWILAVISWKIATQISTQQTADFLAKFDDDSSFMIPVLRQTRRPYLLPLSLSLLLLLLLSQLLVERLLL